jgi:protein required for attachment to host cells
MSATWFVVLSQSSMKLFRADKEKSLNHFKTVTNPLAHLKGKDLTRHKPGAMPKGGKGSRRSILNGGMRPQDIANESFAMKMAKFLDDARRHARFDNLRIAAEPGFLGMLRHALPEATRRLVNDWVPKDLDRANTRQLARVFVPREHFGRNL